MAVTVLQKVSRALHLQSVWFRRAVKAVWIVFFLIIVGGPLYILSVKYNLFGLYGDMPSLKQIENPENDLSSEVISADGVSLGRYFRFNRSQVPFNKLSPALVKTLITSEDIRFYEHSGVDSKALIRAVLGAVTFRSSEIGGGSTLTQQLAKNLFTLNPELDGSLAKLGRTPRRVIQKTKEWIISIYLERHFTKQEILAMYLNTCHFGNNAFGIKVAAETYFAKQPDKLNVQESAVLVGMLQSPALFNPKQHPEAALAKRNQVLYKLYRVNYWKTKLQYDSVKVLPIDMKYSVQNQNKGLATYFRTVITPELTKWCKENGYDLLESGLRIHTTLDSRMQRYAEEAVTEQMKQQQKKFSDHWKGRNPWIDDNRKEIKGFLDSRIKQSDAYRMLVAKYGVNNDSVKIMLNLKKRMTVFTWQGERDTLFSSMDSLNYYKRFLQTGFMSMDPRNGAVKAWVGGINHKYFKYDHVRQGSRQPGSTFKPFVYGTAMEQGYNPNQKFQDISPTFTVSGGKTWRPANAEGDYGTGEWITLRMALAKSKNTVTAQLMQRVGIDNVVNFAHRAGIASKLDAVPTLCLGVSDVSLYELVGAYGTFVNLGIYTEPYYITRIEDKHGNLIQSFAPKIHGEVINEQTAYKILYLLRGVVEEHGAGSAGISDLLKDDNEIGGKTGTTSSASDGWFMGVTHDLVAGAWVGGDERSIHYERWSLGQGGKTARPIWESFMLKVYADRSLGYKKGQFRRPSTPLDMTLDPDKYENIPADSVEDTRQWDGPNQ
ncbi:transglycosylase domain-containing protein [Chryseolinea lacunae]|uniref:Penicillin-binding protein n=1 Tax=Chryseolinea lacunae TaxID=2801331 RepID=A0ABS1KXH8_9BACT|nr:transglycosylase domain-containing protein [Chryseolinea lacunae]MBL0744079.1 penicillin-binding protein [Chryseolinea lacunae]